MDVICPLDVSNLEVWERNSDTHQKPRAIGTFSNLTSYDNAFGHVLDELQDGPRFIYFGQKKVIFTSSGTMETYHIVFFPKFENLLLLGYPSVRRNI